LVVKDYYFFIEKGNVFGQNITSSGICIRFAPLLILQGKIPHTFRSFCFPYFINVQCK